MTYPKVKKVLSAVGNGITEPFWCILDNDTTVVYKSIGNPESNKALINEWIGYNIAKLVDLPIPFSGAAIWDHNTDVDEPIYNELTKDDSVSKHYGLGFFSTQVEHSSPITSPSIYNKIKNKDDIPRIVLFDVLIGNYDRNPGNLLLSYKKNNIKLHIIDHSHIFDIGCMWDDIQLDRITSEPIDINKILESNNHQYSMFFEFRALDKNLIEEIINDFNNSITKSKIEDIMNTIPTEWSITSIEKKSAINYLNNRLTNLLSITNDLLKGGV